MQICVKMNIISCLLSVCWYVSSIWILTAMKTTQASVVVIQSYPLEEGLVSTLIYNISSTEFAEEQESFQSTIAFYINTDCSADGGMECSVLTCPPVSVTMPSATTTDSYTDGTGTTTDTTASIGTGTDTTATSTTVTATTATDAWPSDTTDTVSTTVLIQITTDSVVTSISSTDATSNVSTTERTTIETTVSEETSTYMFSTDDTTINMSTQTIDYTSTDYTTDNVTVSVTSDDWTSVSQTTDDMTTELTTNDSTVMSTYQSFSTDPVSVSTTEYATPQYTTDEPESVSAMETPNTQHTSDSSSVVTATTIDTIIPTSTTEYGTSESTTSSAKEATTSTTRRQDEDTTETSSWLTTSATPEQEILPDDADTEQTLLRNVGVQLASAAKSGDWYGAQAGSYADEPEKSNNASCIVIESTDVVITQLIDNTPDLIVTFYIQEDEGGGGEGESAVLNAEELQTIINSNQEEISEEFGYEVEVAMSPEEATLTRMYGLTAEEFADEEQLLFKTSTAESINRHCSVAGVCDIWTTDPGAPDAVYSSRRLLQENRVTVRPEDVVIWRIETVTADSVDISFTVEIDGVAMSNDDVEETIEMYGDDIAASVCQQCTMEVVYQRPGSSDSSWDAVALVFIVLCCVVVVGITAAAVWYCRKHKTRSRVAATSNYGFGAENPEYLAEDSHWTLGDDMKRINENLDNFSVRKQR